MNFSTKQVESGEEHGLLSKLRSSALKDEEALDKFYANAIEATKIEGGFAILIAYDTYDVFSYGNDGAESGSSEMFSYIVCAICPVKNLPESLSFREADSLFHTVSESAVLASCELGFMFPAFDDRKTNIYNALFYTRSLEESYPDFKRNIFAAEPHMPPKAQKATINECLAEVLSEECSLEVVRSVHAQFGEMVESHKESRDPEPLRITKETVKTVLAGCGVDGEKIEKIDTVFDESFGKGAELVPKNIVTVNKFELETPEVSIKVDPEHRDIISTQTVNGEKYLMIRLTGGVTVNGINLNVDES
jgi:hypothetical protein